jgi:hypothetical protein
MKQLNKFEDLYERFLSLETRMTQPNKFKYLNDHFVSLGTECDGLYSCPCEAATNPFLRMHKGNAGCQRCSQKKNVFKEH